jgi:hypothetical protein
MINENFIIDSFGDESTSDYLKSVPVGYLRSKGFDESLIEEAANATQWNIVRSRRTQLIAESDWMANSDVVMTPEWIAYRQALRDITDQQDPFNIIWPIKPE